MRTTVTIDDELLRQAKAIADSSGRRLGDVVDDALRVLLATRERVTQTPFELPVFYGRGGLQPGVDLEDKDALYDLLDAPDDDDAAH